MSATQAAESLGWRGSILSHFTRDIASVAQLTIVADPDQLLTEQGVLGAIRERGFDLMTFNDHIAFRYEYESRYRQHWDRGEKTNLVVVLRAPQADSSGLPYDLLQKARRVDRILTFSIGELFPNLTPTVVAQLDRADLDALHAAQERTQPGPLGENATKDFVLQHVFSVAPEMIKTDVDLLRMLLDRHYSGRIVPPHLNSRLVERLRNGGRFTEWCLEDLLSTREVFFSFLEERWPIFVRKHVAHPAGIVSDGARAYGLRYAGPEDLPFEHDSIRIYIDNLFVEGYLAPTDVVPKSEVRESWIRYGVSGDPETDALERFKKLTEIVEREVPTDTADHRAWIEFALRWAEWSALRWSVPAKDLVAERDKLERLHDAVEGCFASWMIGHFAALHSRSYLPTPAMVHQVASYMAHGWNGGAKDEGGKLALVVIDGLALSQWVALRRSLETGRTGRIITDGAVFSWVPTLTSVSRQAIFASEAPFLFAKSIGTTQKEPSHWSRFWAERKVAAAGAQYVCQKSGEPESALLGRIREAAEDPQCRVLGVVVGTIDQMMHGSPTGSAGLHAQVDHWAKEGHFAKIVEMLLDEQFSIFVTADHGNIEAAGFGRPNVGATAEARGERVHIFADETIRAGVHRDFSKTVEWPPTGLPENYLALLATGRFAFASEGARAISHGGICLEEVVVPFVEIRGS